MLKETESHYQLRSTNNFNKILNINTPNLQILTEDVSIN